MLLGYPSRRRDARRRRSNKCCRCAQVKIFPNEDLRPNRPILSASAQEKADKKKVLYFVLTGVVEANSAKNATTKVERTWRSGEMFGEGTPEHATLVGRQIAEKARFESQCLEISEEDLEELSTRWGNAVIHQPQLLLSVARPVFHACVRR